MKIVAGMGSIDEYERFVEAGADEFFCGYVPYSWSKKYGTIMPLNRREVLCYNVQLGAFSELEILSDMIKKYKKPVHLTFNSLYYLPEQYLEIADIIRQCMSLGFRSYIIADPALLVYLREDNVDCEIHLSGETGEVNSQMANFFAEFGLKRLIFHRKNTFQDMASVTEKCKKISEFEAFILNEQCQFTGAFCNSLHCDEMGYLCRVPYQIGTISREEAENGIENTAENTTENARKNIMKTVAENLTEKKTKNATENLIAEVTETEKNYDDTGYLCGETGCGLCALYQLQKAGITHLKLVGRGNYVDYMEKDIRNLRKALDILENAENEADFIHEMKKNIFSGGCSGNCYYYEK